MPSTAAAADSCSGRRAPGVRPRKLGYYARSLAALAGTVARRRQLLERLWRPEGDLVLRDGTSLRLARRLDLLILKETVCDDVYGLGAVGPAPRAIVDVGAGIGDFTVAAARRHPDCRVQAFEPDPAEFRLLADNVRRNGVANVELHAVALGAGGRPLEPFLDGARVDLLKVDCEGCEVAVLAGLGPAAMAQVRRVAVEYHDVDGEARGDAVEALLARAGFAVRRRPDPYAADLGYVEAWRDD